MKIARVTVAYVSAADGSRQRWTELVYMPDDARTDKVASRCQENMRRLGYDTLGVSWQLVGNDWASALAHP